MQMSNDSTAYFLPVHTPSSLPALPADSQVPNNLSPVAAFRANRAISRRGLDTYIQCAVAASDGIAMAGLARLQMYLEFDLLEDGMERAAGNYAGQVIASNKVAVLSELGNAQLIAIFGK